MAKTKSTKRSVAVKSRKSTDEGMQPLGKMIMTFDVNGRPQDVIAEPHMLLIDVIREAMDLKGTKRACASGNCGACTVLVDGVPACSCMTLAVTVRDRSITTIEGLAEANGNLHPLQQAFIDHCAAQCGFCTAGMLLTAAAFLRDNPNPSRDDVKDALSGNLCRCTGYVKIIDAVFGAAGAVGATAEMPA